VATASGQSAIDIIRDCLDELGVNVTEGAKALGVTRAALSRVLKRKAAVSAEMAVRLEKAIGSSAAFGFACN
jgi:addiction module HigA family antidote